MFVERSTDDGCEVVVLRYAAAFYCLMWPTLVLSVLASVLSFTAVYIAAGVAWALLLAVAIPYWPVTWRLKQQMRNASVTGSEKSIPSPIHGLTDFHNLLRVNH